MRTSETINELATALSVAQGELQDADKASEGYGYKYADLAQVLQIARPILSKHGLSVVQLPHNEDGGIALTTRLMHKSGEWLEETLVMPAEKSKNLSLAQDIGKIITYSRRYMYTALVGITQEDTDATNKKNGAAQEMVRVEMPRKVADSEAAKTLRAAAADGVESLADTWKTLTPAERKDLAGLKEQLKAEML